MVPGLIPVTIPDTEFTVPTAALLLLHMPPAVRSLKVSDAAEQIIEPPLIIPGVGLTVSPAILLQPDGSV